MKTNSLIKGEILILDWMVFNNNGKNNREITKTCDSTAG
jgi:hypothetical protein